MISALIPDRRLRTAAGGLLVLCAASLWAAQAMAFECPTPQRLSHPGVLRETPAQTRQLEAVLGDGDTGNHVPVIVDDLRRRYPGVANAEIRNYLITAYCPVVAQLSGLDDAGKRARMTRFDGEISRAIHSTAAAGQSRPKTG